MEMTPESNPGSSSAKRTRAKPAVAAQPAAEAAPAAKKPRAPRRTLTTKSPAAEDPAGTPEPSSEELDGMIATAAYYLAAARNFTPGHELEDWLEAERSIRAKLYGSA